jgi:hypothetical protein
MEEVRENAISSPISIGRVEEFDAECTAALLGLTTLYLSVKTTNKTKFLFTTVSNGVE